MHCDGKDKDIASTVKTNNLVYVNDVRSGGMIDWIRSSGLIQEEAALIQPGYPILGITQFSELSAPNTSYQANGFVVSQPTFRSHQFEVSLPVNFLDDPSALQEIFDSARAGVQASSFADSPGAGFLFGSLEGVLSPFGDVVGTTPENLEESL